MINRNNKSSKIFLIALSCIALCFVAVIALSFLNASPVLAQQENNIVASTEVIGETTGLGSEDPRIIIARIIRIFLGLLGAVALVMIIYAGFLYMTSGGDPAKITKAKQIMINTIIGLTIIASAFAIVSYIIGALEEAFGIGGNETAFTYSAPGLGSGSLGRVLQDHFPSVGMTVPRNTVIMATFIEPIFPSSVITSDTITCNDLTLAPADQNICTGASCVVGTITPDNNIVCTGKLSKDAIKLYTACSSVYPAGAVTPDSYDEDNRSIPNVCNDWKGDPPIDSELIGDNDAVEITITSDFKTIIFNPYGMSATDHLGSPLADTGYLIQLTNNIINLARNTGAFNSEITKSYTWDFTTNTEIDVTPPFITGVYPVELDANDQPIALSDDEDNLGYPRNTRIRVDFSEAVIPPVYLNITSNDPNDTANLNAEMLITYDTGSKVALGQFVAGINRYQSVIFKSTEVCGSGFPRFNSCGDLITCLPANATIQGQVNSVDSGTLVETVGPTVTLFPAGGIVDAALNALDTDGNLGEGDGATSGASDDFDWSFRTSNVVDIEPPRITEVRPLLQADRTHSEAPTMDDDAQIGVTPDSLVTATFDKAIDTSTATNSSMAILSDDWDGWRAGGLFCDERIAADGSEFCVYDNNRVMIHHSNFSLAGNETEIPLFYPTINSGLQDMSGNCFNPAGEQLKVQVKPKCGGVTIEKGQSCCATFPDGMTIIDSDECPN